MKISQEVKLLFISLLCVFFVYLELNFSELSLLIFFFSILTYFFSVSLINEKSILHVMSAIGFSTFLFVPALINFLVFSIPFTLFFMSSSLFCLFIYMTRKTSCFFYKDFTFTAKKTFFLFLFSSLIVLLISFFLGNLVVWVFPVYVFIFSYLLKEKNFLLNSALFLIFLIPYFHFLFFTWSGFGRILTFGWLITAFVMIMFSMSFRINRFYFPLIFPFFALLLVGRNTLVLNESFILAALDDSAFSPYRVTSEFFEHFKVSGYDFLSLLDQFIFSIFVFIPRTLWEEKPIGFGFLYTIENSSQYLINAGHSIAPTLLGEHIYYMGFLGWITAIFSVLIVSVICNFSYKLKSFNGFGVVVPSSLIMGFFWGGMTSFFPRATFPFILMLFCMVFLRFYSRIKF